MSTPNADHPSQPHSDTEGQGPVLVLFDWNGTVMNDVARAAAAANQALEKFGLVLTEEEFQLGFTLPLRDWFSDLGVPDAHTGAAADHWNRAMEVEAAARGSARATVTELREHGVVTGVVTAAAPGSVHADLRANGLDGLFDHIHTDVEDKVACLSSLRHLGGSAIYVGDTAYDVSSAREAGYTAVSIGGGYQHASVLAGARPDHHIEDLPGVLELAAAAVGARPAGRGRGTRPLSLEHAAGAAR